jgi:hypothetical protein
MRLQTMTVEVTVDPVIATRAPRRRPHARVGKPQQRAAA